MAGNDDLRIWQIPQREGKYITGLFVRNSLFPKEKVEFIPEEERKIRWYCCGPTVYDATHLGHARTYIACDTIRSILEKYFNYDVHLAINITDIDDKIIQRANSEGKDFKEIARYWECEFFDDMNSLGVSPPDRILRVSEFIPEIIEYIETIIAKGYAYESEGSVYFDIEAFCRSGKHVYAKLEPTSFRDIERLNDAEGALGEVSAHKKSQNDFALWKKSKKDEPYWPSPWGNGRPGWHIECSAMCKSAFGKDTIIDVHSGGIDLRFPHHDNEIAQSEAFSDQNKWVNYFLHFGHLHIQGLKMGKSLKNFISVKELLSRYSPRQLRILFLLSRYDSTLNYNPGPEGMAEVIAMDDMFFNFFSLLESRLDSQESTQKFSAEDIKLQDSFNHLKDKVHEALLDNFDTPKVLLSISKFIGMLNSHLSGSNVFLRQAQGLAFKRYLYRILEILKLVEPGKEYGNDGKVESLGSTGGPLLGHLVELRKQARVLAQENFKLNINKSGALSLLKTCDAVRDEWLPPLGIILEDGDNGEVLIKYKSSEEQERERKLKDELKQQKTLQQTQRVESASIPPEEFIMRKYPGRFANFDGKHLPTQLADGTPISKSERQSLEKMLEKHIKRYFKRQPDYQ